MDFGGIFGDDKSNTLEPIASAIPASVPNSYIFNSTTNSDQSLLLELTYPLVLKPNNGYRGTNVAIIHDKASAVKYLETHSQQTTLLQEYIAGEEFGVFYIKPPEHEKGFIYSIVNKKFPSVTGDGVSTLETLILQDARAVMMAPTFLEKHSKQLNRILAKGEVFQLVDVGSHCRGALFLDANEYISEKLSKSIEQLAKAIPEFHFGRFDIRVDTIDSFRRGENIKVLEVNGVTAEAAHIYDPKNSLFDAYKVMFKQWEWAFKIGKANKERGFKPIRLKKILTRWLQA
ncbi:hypothetical protein [Kangiella sp. HZ709]|uniref:hypothetical protein n=1 Tax=Kangiella sp. HZ709 TaxID=2666328 RepID=UPI0012AF5BB6|nr:hypothetical protein [Kangiella sp. HZ709]MRX27054.1 hypothetical protein [Kangiella sp. HZ709]